MRVAKPGAVPHFVASLHDIREQIKCNVRRPCPVAGLSSTASPTLISMSFETTVLIATCGRPDSLLRTLGYLSAVEAREAIAKVVVVENDDQTRLEDRLRDLPLPIEHHFLDSKNKSAALNFGLRHCADGLILLTDDDVEINPDWLKAYLAVAEQHPDQTFFGGVTEARYDVTPHEALLPYITGSMKSSRLGGNDGWVNGATGFLGFNWAAWRRDLLAIGGFDPRFGPGAATGATGQESDAQRRLRKLGCRGYRVSAARITHHVEEHQVTPDWIVSRRRRAGRELGLIVGDAVPAPLRSIAVRSAVACLRFKFERQHGRCREPEDFHRRWWRSYLEGALESVGGYRNRAEMGEH